MILSQNVIPTYIMYKCYNNYYKNIFKSGHVMYTLYKLLYEKMLIKKKMQTQFTPN